MFSQQQGNLRDALRIVLPLVLAMGANAVNQFTDRIFLARFSDAAIQASLPGGILSWLFVCLLVATAGYSGTFVAQYHGAGSRRDAAAACGQGIWLTLLSLPLLLVTIPLGHAIFDLCGHAPSVVADEKAYYDILQLGGVFCILGAVLSGYFAGVGRTRIIGVATVLGNLSNILLDWMFIFGHCGCDAWGIRGAGWATALAAAVPCIILGTATLFDDGLRGRRVLTALRLRPTLLRQIVRYGFPSGLHQFFDCATFAIFVMLTGRFDAMSFAVSNIAFSINHLSFAPLVGLSQGAQVLAGQFQGAHDPQATIRATKSCLLLALSYVALFASMILLFPNQLMTLFRGDASAFDPVAFNQLGHTLLWLLLTWAAFDATGLVLGGALKGTGDTKFVMWSLSLVSLGLWVPALFLIMRFAPSVTHLWITMPFYCGACTLIAFIRFARGAWKRHRLV